MATFTSDSHVAELWAGYVSKGIWQRSFVDNWMLNAQRYPDKEALVDSRYRLTWAQAMLATDRIALGLRALGIPRDGTIAVQLPWSVEFALLRAAHERAGIVAAELAYTLRHQELSHLLARARAQAVVIPGVFRDFDYVQMIEEIRPELPELRHVIVAGPEVPRGALSLQEMMARPIEASYPADYLARERHSPFEMSVLWHTTGTTGLPKLVENAPAAVEWAGRKHHTETGEKLTADDVCAVICPAITGPNVLPFHGGSLVGARIVLMEQFRPAEALRLFEQEKVTVTAVVPAQLAMMLDLPDLGRYDLRSLRFIICAGASLNYELARQAEEVFGCPVVQHYGAQENGVVTLVQHPSEPQWQRLLTVGKPAQDCEMRVVDDAGRALPPGEVGQIEARGPCMSGGYHRDEEGTRAAWTADGFYRMGDLGKFDEQGNVILLGRAKEMIIRGGQNISPIEIENLLLSHPKVSRAAVAGLPDPVMGERVCAFVVPRAGESLSFEEVVAHFKAKKVASYKIPERLELRETFPLAGEQKIDKKALLQELQQRPAGL